LRACIERDRKRIAFESASFDPDRVAPLIQVAPDHLSGFDALA
jgi:hypothetical protein